MNELIYHFSKKNTVNKNYIVYPGSSFRIKDFTYKIFLLPYSDFWKFGIRCAFENHISFSEDFPNVYSEIYIQVKRIALQKDTLSLIYRDSHGNEHLLAQDTTYNGVDFIQFEFKFDETAKALHVGYNIEGRPNQFETIEFDIPYEYFKFFAWSDHKLLELEARIRITEQLTLYETEGKFLPIELGNITFRVGDIFDSYSSNNNSIIVFPIANDGLLRGIFHEKIKDLGIPFPEKNEAGEVILHKTRSNLIYPYVAYAYSVHNNSSTNLIISIICRNLIKQYLSIIEINKTGQIINVPLLGTGAGRLDCVEVAKIYDEEFNKPFYSQRIVVSIQNSIDFEKIKEYFTGRYIQQFNERIYKPEEIRNLENMYSVEIDFSSFLLNNNGNIVQLTLSDLKIDSLPFLNEFIYLESLTFKNCFVENYADLEDLPFLKELRFNKCEIENFDFLIFLHNLITLEIHSISVKDFSFLMKISLENLSIINCEFKDSLVLQNNKALKSLNLERCNLIEILGLQDLLELQYLYLASNRISNIQSIVKLKKLKLLTLNDNKINNISPVLMLKKLTYLRAEMNPFLKDANLILNQNENHLQAILNFYSRQSEHDKVRISLPAKVILLGNHASGKSSLLDYIINGEIKSEPGSTHLIKIEKHCKNSDIPEAIYFDFGGQDYYHGMYRAFLSSGSIYLILWNLSNNINQQRMDTYSILTQDFTLSYWLSQKKYLENEKFDGNIDPVFVIQSRSDEDTRTTIKKNEHQINNEFFVSLKPTNKHFESDFKNTNDHALKYLKSSIEEQINLNRATNNEPVWYKEFLDYILQESKIETYISKNVSKDILPNYKRKEKNKLYLLEDDLDQLHKRGLILYYKNEISNKVWLNPESLVKYIHDYVLNKEKVGQYNGCVPESYFKEFDQDIITLLCEQKVIFRHVLSDKIEYITPNFLPLINKSDPDFDLFTFDLGHPNFILKFLNFLPFGIINQLICLFKDQDDDKKKFWRNQLLFTFKKKAKILIFIDFEKLEIKVHTFFRKEVSDTEKKDIHRYLFYCIISVYWDLNVLSYEEYLIAIKGNLKKEDYDTDSLMNQKIIAFESVYEKQECRPLDLFISTDEKHFVNYEELCSEDNHSQMINSKIIDFEGNFTNKNIPVPVYNFQIFTQKSLKKIKKVVISYSKRDLKLVNKFKDYLVPLYQNGLIESPWYCTELIAGQEWNEEIKQKFSEADIVFFMISENLMSTKYVLENEIKDAIDRWDRDKSIKIVPIILEPYNFIRKEPYNLARFSALPYMLRAITQFKNQKLAWYTISESIKIMIEKDLYPDNSVELSNEIKRIYEEFVKEKWGEE